MCGGLLGHGDGAEDARPVAKSRRHNKRVDVLCDVRHAQVTVKQRLYVATDERKELLLLHNAAAHDDALWTGDKGDIDAAQREIVRLEFPSRVVGW